MRTKWLLIGIGLLFCVVSIAAIAFWAASVVYPSLTSAVPLLPVA